MPPSPSLQWVHAAAGLSRRFRTWLDKACKNYDELLKLEGVVDNRLRRERREELTGAERTAFTEALMEYDRLVDGLEKFAMLKSFEDFVSFTGENLIKWVGDEIVSLGYCGFRERSSQYWLWDYRAEKLPYEKKVRQVFEFYGLDTRIYGLSVPSQEQAESWLFEFLENVKKWPRSHIEWLVRNVYPLSDKTGGFWVVTRKIVELESLRDAWEDIVDRWEREVRDELERMAQFEVLKTMMTEGEAQRFIEREIIPAVKDEILDKYGMTTQDPAWVRMAFRERAVEVFLERVPVESAIIEVYEQLKPLVPADKVERTKAGLLKAIRWLFLHPTMSLDAFVSTHVFPLDFTTEEARAIGLKISEKVTKKLLYPPAPPPVPPVVPEKVSREEFMRAFDEALFEWIPHAIEGSKPGLAGRLHYEAPEFEAETLAKFSMDTVLSKWENVIAKEKEEQYRRYAETTPEHAKRILADVPELARNLAISLVNKTEKQLFEEAKAKARAPPPAPPKPPVRPPVEVPVEAPPPKPKVLPPIPETCPIDGTLLEQIEKVPVLAPVRLTAEEEYFRARLGLPVPTFEAVMIDVPPTMKIWQCRGVPPHFFEREDGRLVERTQEFLYRKILRERARLERIIAPPPPTPVPVELPPYRPERAILPNFWEWLLENKGLTIHDWAKRSESDRKADLAEFEAWAKRIIRERFGLGT